MEQIQHLAHKLQAVGLTEKQARVYVAALFLGPSPVQHIAKQAGVNRATTYIILNELADRGLVSQSTEGKKSAFVAEDPYALRRWLEKQEHDIRARRAALEQVMPGLEAGQRMESSGAPRVRFYRGEEGARETNEYLRRKARVGSVIYGMVNIDELLKIFPKILEEGPELRRKKRISSNLFYSYTKGELPSGPQSLRENIRLVTPVQADMNIFDGGVVFATYRGKNSIGIIIESREIADVMRQLFMLAWDAQKKHLVSKT